MPESGTTPGTEGGGTGSGGASTSTSGNNDKMRGPSGWKFLDAVIEGCPVKAGCIDQMQMLDFLTSLGHILPCEICRKNCDEFTSKCPPIECVGTKKKVQRWLQAYKNKGMNSDKDKMLKKRSIEGENARSNAAAA